MEIQNMGICGPTKRTRVLQKLFLKVQNLFFAFSGFFFQRIKQIYSNFSV